MRATFLSFIVVFISVSVAHGQKVLVDDRGQPSETKQIPTGKKAADEYIRAQKKATGPSIWGGGEDRFLALHIAPYVDSDIHNWGVKSPDNEGKYNLGVTYRLGEWSYSSDLMFRAAFDIVEINGSDTTKLSLMPIFSFPDARSDFPLYFGGGIGLGVFLDQTDDESKLSFDYTILAGARFFNVIENVGFMFEVGLNNHVFLTSTGQFSGTYIAAGTVFEF